MFMNPRYFQEIIFGDREMFLIKSLISVKFIQAICTYLETNKKKKSCYSFYFSPHQRQLLLSIQQTYSQSFSLIITNKMKQLSLFFSFNLHLYIAFNMKL